MEADTQTSEVLEPDQNHNAIEENASTYVLESYARSKKAHFESVAHIRRAMTDAFDSADWQTCLDSALQLEALWPEDKFGSVGDRYRRYRAEALIGLGRVDEAIALYDRANDDPNQGSDYVGLDLTLELALAIQGRLPDETATAIINAARVPWDAGDPLPIMQNRDWSRDEALAIVRTARAVDAEFTGLWDKALREATAALRLDPSRGLAADYVGRHLKSEADNLYNAGDKQQARALYRQAEPLLRRAAQLGGSVGTRVRERLRDTYDSQYWRQKIQLDQQP